MRRDDIKTKAAQKKKKGKGFLYFRLFLCFLIIGGAVTLKYINAPIVEKLSEAVNAELKVTDAIETINGMAEKGNSVIEVFQKEKEEEEEAEQVFENDYYIDEEIKEIEKEVEEENQKKEMREKELSVEALSFQMSEEELLDDTKAEVFKIPPPSNSSYTKEQINFKYKAPLFGVVTSRFGYRDHPIMDDASFHTGIDIAAKSGKDVTSFADGKVISAGKNSVYGNYVLIEHSSGIRTFYGHNSKLYVKQGQKVSLGQKIAAVGSTGMSTGPHLHFEIRKGNIRLDPSYYISPETI